MTAGSPSSPNINGPRTGVAIPAAGVGRRMGGVKKPLLELCGEPLLVHALRPFLADPRVVAVRVALAPEDAADPPEWIAAMDPRIQVVAGGAERADSVANAVAALPANIEVILVHDGARPLIRGAAIDACIRMAATGKGAVVGIPATDTFKQVDTEARVVGTPDRSRLWHAQTPQGFPAAMLRSALERTDLRATATDDASLVEAAGGEVVMVEGAASNLKVTRPQDLPLAEFWMKAIEQETAR